MARPDHRKARKDYPEAGIVKGDMYWYVQIKTGPRSSRVMRQKTPFKRSQLTTSAYLSQLYDWEDDVGNMGSMEEAQDLADRIGALGDEQEDSKSNMPDHLQDGDTGTMLQERKDACEAAKEEIEEIIGRWEEAQTEHEGLAGEYDEAQRAVDAADNDEDREAAQYALDLLDDPGDFDDSEFVSEVQAVSVDS